MMRIADRRYLSPVSAPIGRIDLRPALKVRARKRTKPKSWATGMWFRSALFARGQVSRARAFSALVRGARP